MDDNIIIRKIEYNETDHQMVRDFFKTLGPEGNQLFNAMNYNGGRMERYFDKTDGGTVSCFMACDGEGMLGLVFLAQMNKTVPSLGIAISAEQKGKHLGSRLMSFIIDYAKQLNKAGIILTTHIANVRGQALYDKFGFERVGIARSTEILYLMRFDDRSFRPFM